METVTTHDGIALAYTRSGKGQPLVLVHGTTADHTRWMPLLPSLEAHFTVYALDRRGRGASGDAATYAIEDEFADIVAVIDSIREPVNLLGHSYGALCSLEAALRTDHLRKLVLYEPPIPVGMEIYPPGAIERFQGLLEQGRREEVVMAFFREIALIPPQELQLLQSLPNWPARVAAAQTIPREMSGSDTYHFKPERVRSLNTPTLLLLGGDSPAFLKAATKTLHEALPNSHIAVMPGQQHTAMNTAPELFVREVLQFLLAD